MTGTYNAYLSNGEKFFAVLEAAMNSEVTNAIENVNIIMAKDRIREAAVEDKIITESGTYEEMEVLLEAAGEEAVKNSKSFLAKILEAIRNFFRNLGQKISAMFKSDKMKKLEEEAKNSKESVKAAKDPNKVHAIFAEARGWVKQKLSKLSTGGAIDPQEIEDYRGKMKKRIAAVGGVTLAAGAAVAMGKAMNAKSEEYIKETDAIERQLDQVSEKGKVESVKELLNFYSWAAKEVGKDTLDFITGIGHSIMGKLPIGKKDDDDGGVEDGEEVKESANVMGYNVDNETFLEATSPIDAYELDEAFDALI